MTIWLFFTILRYVTTTQSQNLMIIESLSSKCLWEKYKKFLLKKCRLSEFWAWVLVFSLSFEFFRLEFFFEWSKKKPGVRGQGIILVLYSFNHSTAPFITKLIFTVQRHLTLLAKNSLFAKDSSLVKRIIPTFPTYIYSFANFLEREEQHSRALSIIIIIPVGFAGLSTSKVAIWDLFQPHTDIGQKWPHT